VQSAAGIENEVYDIPTQPVKS